MPAAFLRWSPLSPSRALKHALKGCICVYTRHAAQEQHGSLHNAQTRRTLTCTHPAAVHIVESKPFKGITLLPQCQAVLMSGCYAGRGLQHGIQATAGEVQARRQGCAGV